MTTPNPDFSEMMTKWRAEQKEIKAKQVECLGQTFPDDAARREHFRARLAEKLADPEFRKQPGFPNADAETILRLSDPPYYTACPNPFLGEFIARYGKPYQGEPYYRVPFAVDVNEGKTHAIYKAHGYHTKVPHLAIVPCILHYTNPGDVVLDGFCGSGMTGVATQWCATAPTSDRTDIEARFRKEGLDAPKWGPRRVVLNDLAPAASFIAANYNLPFDVDAFTKAGQELLVELGRQIGWMYETLHSDGKTKGRIEYVVWAQLYSCPECSGEINFYDEAMDEEGKRVKATFPCPSCGAELSKNKLERLFSINLDPVTNTKIKTPKSVPVLMRYEVKGVSHEKTPDANDLATLAKIEQLGLPPEVPCQPLPTMHMTHERARMDYSGITHVHHFFLPRARQALAVAWRLANDHPDPRTRNMLVWFVEQAIWTLSKLNRYRPTGFSQVNQYMTGVYYVPSQNSECSPWYAMEGKLKRLSKTFDSPTTNHGSAWINTGAAASLPLPAECIDYIYTDPPFGENIYYADLNYLVESWHQLITDATPEAIVDRHKKKQMRDYQNLMESCFREYFRVLKPGRWMTMVFSNSRNTVWIAIQEALSRVGFIVADVSTMDTGLGSFRQTTSTAVKQNLVITAYKANGGLEDRFNHLADGTPDGAWDFVRTHLNRVPVVLHRGDSLETVNERTAHALFDRMTAFHVQRKRRVPLSSAEFRQGLEEHFAERDGMYFLPEQVAAYDQKRQHVTQVEQLTINVTDEASAIAWLRQELREKPREIQDLFNDFKKQLTVAWPKHERPPELKTLLDDNFLLYRGDGPVPPQIHNYLSTNFKDLRNREKTDQALVAKATDRWFVPDPKRQGDVDKLREKRLLKEFQTLAEEPTRKLKTFRLEAIRAGFRDAWQKKTKEAYETIIRVAEKLPEEVLQGDDKLLMYYDQAQTRLGDNP
jgi:hypothetical protein